MSDDSFIREVEEELRSDQLKSFWDRWGKVIIAAAVLIVVGTAGYRFWLSYSDRVAGESGDRFIEAVDLSNEGKHDEAIAVLNGLTKDGHGQYPALATIRLAAEYAKQGEPQKAVEAYDSIANDTGFDETLRKVAQLRAGLLLVDHGSFDEVSQRLEDLSGAGLSFRHAAREGLGLSAWKEKNYEKALGYFTTIREDAEAPGGARARAGIMLELLAGVGVQADE